MSKEINKRSEINTSVATALLASYRSALYEIEKFYKSINLDDYGNDIELKIKVTKAILEAGEKISKNIESLDKLEDKVKREERESISRRGGSETSLFEE
jgi:glycerol dehydrogenase-like iron-containing ADH family enzyme